MKRSIVRTNCDLYDCLSASIDRDAEFSWHTLAETRPERFAHILDYLGDGLGQDYGTHTSSRLLLGELSL